MTATMWILGFIAGVAALVVTVFLSPVGVALVVVVSLLRPRPAAAAGACVVWGSAFLITMWRAVESCAALNRQRNASCTLGDNSLFAAVGLAVLALGIGLTVYAMMQARRDRSASASP
jgi:hypothetical protein